MITIQKLIDYSNTAYFFLQKKKENKDTKLGYAINRMAKKVEKALTPYRDLLEAQQVEIDEINIRNASTDKNTGVLIYDTTRDEQGKEVRNYKYTPEALIKRNAELRRIVKEYNKTMESLLEQEVTLESPYFATELPKDLTEQEKNDFSGIVLSPLSITKAESNGVMEAAEI